MSPEDITNQQQLLATYRRNLDYLLQQAAEYGGEDDLPLALMNNLADIRANIAQIKRILRSAQVVVEDKPHEEAPPALLIVAPPLRSVPQGSKRRWHWWLLGGLLLIMLLLIVLPTLLPNSGVQMAQSPQRDTNSANTTDQSGAAITAVSAGSSNGEALPAPAFATAQPTPLPLAALNISNTPGRSENAQIAVDGSGIIHLMWLDDTPRQGKGQTVLYRHTRPDGTWSGVEDMTPDLPVSGKLYLVTNRAFDICVVINSVAGIYTRCFKNGAWSELANPVVKGIRNVFAPALTDDGQVRWVFGLNDIRFAGNQLDDGLAFSSDAQFVIDANGVYHVVWHRAGKPYSIEHRYSTDAGTTWQPQQRLTAASAAFADAPRLAADTVGNVYLVWAESGKLLYRRWTAAMGWSNIVERATGTPQQLTNVVTTGKQDVSVVFKQNDCTIAYARLQADAAWNPIRLLTPQATSATCSEQPAIATDTTGQIHVVWLDPGNDGQQDVFYARVPL